MRRVISGRRSTRRDHLVPAGCPRFFSLPLLFLGGFKKTPRRAELPPAPVATQHMCALYELTSQPSLLWFPLCLTPISCPQQLRLHMSPPLTPPPPSLRRLSGTKRHKCVGGPGGFPFVGTFRGLAKACQNHSATS